MGSTGGSIGGSTKQCVMRGGRLVKTARGVVSLAAVVAGMGSGAALSQEAAVRTFDQSGMEVLARNDDQSSPSVGIGFTIDFFGQDQSNLFVNNNGNVTFDEPMSTFTPFELTSTGREIIAPFFADVDTYGSGEPVTYGQFTLGGRQAFVVNYVDVGYFGSPSNSDRLNNFQLVLIDRSDIAAGDADIEFNYDRIVWEAGTASDSDGNGLGGSTARVGWSNGTGEEGTFFEFEGSGVAGAFLDDGPAETSLIRNSRGSSTLGRYVFTIRNGSILVFDLQPYVDSFSLLANDSLSFSHAQQSGVERLLTSGFLAPAGQWKASTQLGAQSTGRNPTTVGARATSLAALSFGRGISDTLTLGATISAQGSSLQNNAFNMDTGFAGAIWGSYSQGGAERTGLQASGSLGYARNSGEIARGRLLTDVALATGQSSVETRAVQASLGYGLTQGAWLVTPSLGFAHYDTTRAAYTESGAAFNASYDAMTTSRTVATLALSGDMKLGERGRLSLGAGVEHDLSVTAPRLTGTSDIPGLATFDIGSTFETNKTRGFVTAGYTHDFGNGQSLSGTLRVGQAVYGSTPSIGVGLNYGMRF
jgi:hypothetical protein